MFMLCAVPALCCAPRPSVPAGASRAAVLLMVMVAGPAVGRMQMAIRWACLGIHLFHPHRSAVLAVAVLMHVLC